MSESLPERIGRYEIRGKIAEGGTAVVYAGRLVGPGGFERLHALKVIRPEHAADPEFADMLLDEARIVAKARHPAIVQIHELGEEGGRPFVAMELVLGESLWDVWQAARLRLERARQAGEKPPPGTTGLPHDLASWIGARIAEGLHHAHELADSDGKPLRVVHRDVNPSNVLVGWEGEVKIIDFGLAKAQNRLSETGFGVVKGKLAYLSPEQAAGTRDLDRRADVFALGITLWELTTDRRLFKREDDATTLEAVARAEVPRPDSIVEGHPPALWRILERALRKDREERFPSALEMARELDAFSRSQGRVVTAATLAELMKDLFGGEWERAAKWMQAVSSNEPPAEMLHPRGSGGDRPAVLVGQLPGADDAETRRERRRKKAAPKRTLASAATPKTEPAPLPPPVVEPAELRVPAWQWIAVGIVVAVAAAMAFFASRL